MSARLPQRVATIEQGQRVVVAHQHRLVFNKESAEWECVRCKVKRRLAFDYIKVRCEVRP